MAGRRRWDGDIEEKEAGVVLSLGPGGKASFDGPRVPGLPRDLTLTESQKWKRKDEPPAKATRELLGRSGMGMSWISSTNRHSVDAPAFWGIS